METLNTRVFKALTVIVIFLLTAVAYAKDAKLSVEELVAKHLESIGIAQAREAVKSRMAEGTVLFTEVISGSVRMQGTAQLICQGRKMKTAFQFGQPQYRGEQFVFDGNSGQVAMTDPGQRSLLGNFLYTQTEILNEGLLGGTLFTSWPLLNLKERQARLKYEGLKKINNRELHELSYVPKKRAGNGELQIHLYFEPETFRHVMTVYLLVVHNSSGSIKDGTDEVRETVEERFDDFTTMDGLTLPKHWEIRYRREPSRPQELLWDTRISGFRNNAL